MSTIPYGLKNDYVTGNPPSANDLNRRADIIAAQTPYMLEIFGDGVVQGFEVTGVNNVTSGIAIIRGSDTFLVIVRSLFALTISDYAPGVLNYVHLKLAIPALVGQPESVVGDSPVVICSAEEDLPDSILLAEISATGIITDRRKILDIIQLIADVGYDDAARALGTVAQRLAALNPVDGVTAVLWDLLHRTALDDTTIAEYIAQQITDAATNGQSTVLPAQSRDEHAVNILHSLALHQMSVNDAFERVAPHLAFVASPGRGTGAWEFEELTDLVLTDMPYSETEHVLGQSS